VIVNFVRADRTLHVHEERVNVMQRSDVVYLTPSRVSSPWNWVTAGDWAQKLEG